MAIIALMGALNVGKTAILRMFVDYIEKGRTGKFKNGSEFIIDYRAFKGESEIEVKDGKDFSKTITPNRIMFSILKTGRSHTLFAPGGDINSAVIRMGIITISRISLIYLFWDHLSKSLEDQFKHYDIIRYIPKKISIILTKWGKNPEYDLENIIEELKFKITNYFKSRKIIVDRFNIVFFDTENPEFLDYNNEAIRMILDSVY